MNHLEDQYEKMGIFYMGKEYDLEKKQQREGLILYESKDLTTHGICVGMTGSGKTGLCLSLIEEAAIDGIPVIAIDPKGDIGNLMLTFPDLNPADFAPWVDESEAVRKGQTVDEFAASTATLWKEGLASWDQRPERIQRLKDAADVSIFTPGSSAGLPVSLLRSFSVPPQEIIHDADAFNERVQASVSGLLALVGIQADPLRSREHILLSNILSTSWKEGQNLSLNSIIQLIQKPPFSKVGVFDVESFFPEKDRFELALQLNGLLASPGFSTWLEGEPLDIPKLMYGKGGKPRVSIMSIAHLSDSERMFFVTTLLNEMLAWVRMQSGTSSLRAILYMDEIYGFFPPTANPPSKQPMLTLLKQARAYGLGVMLATQNPVDLDYKGLSNTGTWFIGRLQTERDKLRVLDGLESASAEAGGRFDRAAMDTIISGLGKRVFLLNNVHDDGPVIFQTRWAMSYLRGPLTRHQIETLMEPQKAMLETATPHPKSTSPQASTTADKKPEPKRPVIPPDINEVFLALQKRPRPGSRTIYRPRLGAVVRLHFANARKHIDIWETLYLLAEFPDGLPIIEWKEAGRLTEDTMQLETSPEPDLAFASLPENASQEKHYKGWEKELKSFVYQEETIRLYKCKDLKLTSSPGTSEEEFMGQLQHHAHEQRDLEVEKLRKKYAPRLGRLQEKIRKAEQKVERETEQYQQSRLSSWARIGTTLLGAVFGRRRRGFSGAATTIRGMGSASKQKEDIVHAEEDLKAAEEALLAMDRELQEEIESLESSFDLDALDITHDDIRPRKSDITVYTLALVWTPWQINEDGIAEPLW